MSWPDEARFNVKAYLDQNVSSANLTTDDDTWPVNFIVAFGFPDYPVLRVFVDKNVDLVYSLGKANSQSILDTDQVPCLYIEDVPITIVTIDKAGITGVKLASKAESELRRVLETYPTGSQLSLTRSRETTERLGSTVIYQTEYNLHYVRNTTI